MTTLDARERTTRAMEGGKGGGQGNGVARKVLADLVLEAVRHVGAEELNPPVTTEPSPAFQPRAMLAMLTYCYANEVYGSWDVEQMMYEDTAFRALCGRDYPDSRRFRRFRKHNHAVLRRTLEETLRGAWSLNHHPATRGDDASQVSGNGQSSNGLPDAATQELIAREAEHRLEKAMFIDQMSVES